MSAVNVTVIRPKRKGVELLSMVIGHYAGSLFNAWIVMLLVPFVIDRHPGYWQCVAAVVLLGFLLPSDSSYSFWTKAAK